MSSPVHFRSRKVKPSIQSRSLSSDRRVEAIVREGWNRLSPIYRPSGSRADRTGHSVTQYLGWLADLVDGVSPGSRVLDLGCGNGDPTARTLAKRFRVTGIDISDVQIRRARELVPRAEFRRADMTTVRFPPGRFAAVAVLYSMIHVPLRKQRPLLRRIYRWLAPAGRLLAIVGSEAWTGKQTSWLGVNVEMYWSHADADTYQRWLREAGFRVLLKRFVPEGDSGHELFLAKKPEDGESRRRNSR